MRTRAGAYRRTAVQSPIKGKQGQPKFNVRDIYGVSVGGGVSVSDTHCSSVCLPKLRSNSRGSTGKHKLT